MHVKVGDTVALGACLGHAMEPSWRWGRLVAIRHHEEGIKKYVIRKYNPEDVLWPTGGYCTTWLLVPHEDDNCVGA